MPMEGQRGRILKESKPIEKDSADGACAVTGTLKGYDALMNLVLDDVQEVLRGLLPPFLHPSNQY